MTIPIAKEKIIIFVEKKEKLINKNSTASSFAPKYALLCSINGVLKDLGTVLTDQNNLKFISFSDEQGKSTFYHSSAHVLGYSILKFDPTIKLVAGPPTSNGFYYDCYSSRPLKEEDLRSIENIARNFIKKNHKFERLEIVHSTVYDEMYKDNKFKRYFIRRSIDKILSSNVNNITNTYNSVEQTNPDVKDHLSGNNNYMQTDESEYRNNITGNDFSAEDARNQTRPHFSLDQENIDHNITKSLKHIVYKLSDFLDYCTGPHIPNTKFIKCFDILNTGATYFLSDSSRESLTRIYAISFPSKSERDSYYKIMELRKKRHHKIIGEKYDLIYFSELSPGSAFFLPDGAFIYNKLIDYIRFLYRSYGFNEIISPNIYNTSLWDISGHLQNYKDDMFLLSVNKHDWALKPMNCPGHCLVYKSKVRNKRSLPIRYADFGVLHRNEISGALSGLTRVRRFQQDDAHIFCALDQVESEIINQLQFLREVYEKFDFKYLFYLSTRPKENHLGTIKQWNRAESMIASALDKSQLNYEVNPGDGAFYGPKIDIVLTDALERKHQCATIQLDFQLPERFELSYVDVGASDNADVTQIIESGENIEISQKVEHVSNHIKKSRPVIIHRAILGSIERFIGILLEHFGMNLPFWLNPRQVSIIPVAPNDKKILDYCINIKKALIQYQVKLFDSDETLNKRIRNSEKEEKYVINLIIGENEVVNKTVSIRKGRIEMKLDRLRNQLSQAVDERINDVYTLL